MSKLKIISMVIAITAVWMIVRSRVSYIHPLRIMGGMPRAGIVTTILLAIMMLIPLLKLVIAAGLWNGRGWAGNTAVPVLSLDAALWIVAGLHLYMAGRSTAYSPEAAAGGRVVEAARYSMIPGYIVALASITCLVILLRNRTDRKGPAGKLPA